jgi:hypothetical protein
MNPSAFSFATVPNVSLIGYLMGAAVGWVESALLDWAGALALALPWV